MTSNVRAGDGYALRLDTSLEAVIERLTATTAPSVIATLVGTAGSTYRKAGARMLIETDGRITGLLSGGCFEADLREHADGVLSSGTARLVSYDMRGDDDLVFGIGAGCEGAMYILLEPIGAQTPLGRGLRMACRLSAAGKSLALGSVYVGPAAALGTHVWPHPSASLPGEPAPPSPDSQLAAACSAALRGGASRNLRWTAADGTVREAWVQVVEPPPSVLICGAGPDARPLVDALRALRFRTSVVDHRPAYAASERFPGATVLCGDADELSANVDLGAYFAAVVMSHHLASDAAYLRGLGESDIPYIGLLGPRSRRDKLLADLGPLAGRLVRRLRGPTGLDIGALTPEAIALSITAEIHACAAGRAATLSHQNLALPS